MTKEEVLQGALTLNGDDKKYTVTVENDAITVRTKSDSGDVFRCTAHLNDDNTYVETHAAVGIGPDYGGKAASASVTFSFSRNKNSEKIEVEKRSFKSADCKKVLRNYLETCGYKRTNKGFFGRLFKK